MDLMYVRSHPAWDAWIEIYSGDHAISAYTGSHPAWDAWIEITDKLYIGQYTDCRIPHGMRGLKFKYTNMKAILNEVASRMGCVD